MGLYIIEGAQALELDGEIYFGNKNFKSRNINLNVFILFYNSFYV